jgi:hypothetical protein
MNAVITALQGDPRLEDAQEEHLVAYIDALPRDMRFALVKALLQIPQIAAVLTQDRHDAVIFEAIEQISREAS